MSTEMLIREIKRLPVASRFLIMEQILKSLQREDNKRQMALAADALYGDYLNDKELTAFTSLDFENFYETR